LPIQLAELVRHAASEQGTIPGVIVSRLIEQQMAQGGLSAFGAQRPQSFGVISSAELLARVKFRPGY